MLNSFFGLPFWTIYSRDDITTDSQLFDWLTPYSTWSVGAAHNLQFKLGGRSGGLEKHTNQSHYTTRCQLLIKKLHVIKLF